MKKLSIEKIEVKATKVQAMVSFEKDKNDTGRTETLEMMLLLLMAGGESVNCLKQIGSGVTPEMFEEFKKAYLEIHSIMVRTANKCEVMQNIAVQYDSKLFNGKGYTFV